MAMRIVSKRGAYFSTLKDMEHTQYTAKKTLGTDIGQNKIRAVSVSPIATRLKRS
jgi:hypothetical protein